MSEFQFSNNFGEISHEELLKEQAEGRVHVLNINLGTSQMSLGYIGSKMTKEEEEETIAQLKPQIPQLLMAQSMRMVERVKQMQQTAVQIHAETCPNCSTNHEKGNHDEKLASAEDVAMLQKMFNSDTDK